MVVWGHLAHDAQRSPETRSMILVLMEAMKDISPTMLRDCHNDEQDASPHGGYEGHLAHDGPRLLEQRVGWHVGAPI